MMSDAARFEPRPQRASGVARLGVKFLDGKSRLSEFFQEGSAKIRLPETFTPAMEAVLINTSGGLTGGDHMTWQVEAASGTDVTVTTQAFERIYKSAGGASAVNIVLKASSGAKLHWLPQETLLFDQAALKRTLEVDLADDSEFLAVESVLLGRRDMGESVMAGHFKDSWRIRRQGRLIHAEELTLKGAIYSHSSAACVLSGGSAFATLLYCGPKTEAFLPGVRARIGVGQGGASAWQDKLVIRLSAIDGYELRKTLIAIVSHLRDGSCLPKVWSL